MSKPSSDLLRKATCEDARGRSVPSVEPRADRPRAPRRLPIFGAVLSGGRARRARILADARTLLDTAKGIPPRACWARSSRSCRTRRWRGRIRASPTWPAIDFRFHLAPHHVRLQHGELRGHERGPFRLRGPHVPPVAVRRSVRAGRPDLAGPDLPHQLHAALLHPGGLRVPRDPLAAVRPGAVRRDGCLGRLCRRARLRGRRSR